MTVISDLQTARDRINYALDAIGDAQFPPTKTVLRGQIFGDSTRWGYLSEGGGARAVNSPQVLLQKALDLKYGVGTVYLECRAMNGTHSGMLVSGTDGLNSSWPGPVDADFVMIGHGINCVQYGLSDALIEGNFRSLINNCPAKVILLTPSPVSNVARTVAPLIRSLASELGCELIDVRAYIDSVIGSGDKFSKWYNPFAPDGVHCNEPGYAKQESECVIPRMIEIIDAMLGLT